ncbi:MAG TPA: folylpolyglutamate synthase/dihydrofolate synthase family protein [Vicinamibacterales bacterium]|nr:folylpolyglutamate synthase/dihydrofolate synthase family protein [Vicinamibacterales bacterium]
MDALSYLFSLEQFGIKFGLDNIRALLAKLGNPQNAFTSIHIAGTNGKGSVTAMIDTVLRRAGHTSARFTSPHLVDLSERFVVNGAPADAAEMRRAAGEIRRTIEDAIADGTIAAKPTFFEATTAMAFDMFRRAGVEFGVIEVGLGGRLDSTNVVAPAVTAITSIDFDHQQYLGDTLAAIAAEKAGIIKPGVPVVVGALARDASDVIERIARERGAAVIRADETGRDYGSIRLGLRGEHQKANARVAIGVLEALERTGVAIGRDAIVDGLADVRWPGRLEHRQLSGGREIVLDAAHNPAGARALASYLRTLGGPKPTLVFAAMKDKDLDGMLAVLLPAFGRVVVTKPGTPRAGDPAELASRIRAIAPALPIDVVDAPADALKSALQHPELVVVAGSIFLLGDIMPGLGA